MSLTWGGWDLDLMNMCGNKKYECTLCITEMTHFTLKLYLLWLPLKIQTVTLVYQSEFWILRLLFPYHWFIDSVHFAFHPSHAQMSAEKVIFWNMVKIYAILNGLFQVAWIFNTPFLSQRRELCYFWLSLEFSLQSWLVRVSAFKADISFLFSICYINRVNSYRVPKLWRKQLTRLFLASRCNWQHLALSILLAQFSGKHCWAAFLTPRCWQEADLRQAVLWGGEQRKEVWWWERR